MRRLSARERRVLWIIPVAALLVVIRYAASSSDSGLVTPSESIPLAERRLTRLRQLAATVPGKEAVLKEAMTDLAGREKGLIPAETAPQAQAQLLETVRNAAKKNGIDARGAEELRVRPLANDYGEVSVTVNFDCHIEQLVNLLADLTNEPQLLATNSIQITSRNNKEKTIGVRLGLSAAVPRKLVPEKKGVPAF
jgi:type II secretory pathway component PulM